MPMIGLIPAALAWVTKSYAPKTLPWSVIASAGMPIRAVSANRSVSRAAPSSIEYSVWTCRCTNESLADRDTARDYAAAPTVPAARARGQDPSACRRAR